MPGQIYTWVFVFLVISFNSFSQRSLSGYVAEGETKKPLNNVNVIIPELSLNVSTDSSGYFRFSSLPKSRLTIEFKLLGYKTEILSIKANDSILPQVTLKISHVNITEVVIYGSNLSDPKKTANSITQLTVDDMRSKGAMNLSDGISKLPGVSQLSTGAGISKPVIRGLFGNRIQTLLYGLRFDNQQWQDEHGLGLSDVGIDRVEVIKGAASLLYGSEAMGGVINIIEEKNAPVGQIRGDFSSRYFTNTYGVASDIGLKGSNGKINWRVRGGIDSHADYSDGNNKRILNSRFGGYYAKAGMGFKFKNWINQTNYMFTQNNFGFLMDTIQLKDVPDSRQSRSFDRPHHTVNLNIFSSQNSIYLNNSVLKFNLGAQNNERQEQEGGSKVSLDMILNTYVANLVWTKQFESLSWSIGSQGFYQTNKNIGSRFIIPDADQMESSAYSYLKFNHKSFTFEGGIRYDYKHVNTYATEGINTNSLSPGYSITPFSRDYNALNGSFGVCWDLFDHLLIKSNFSSGYRAGNLAELSSNGLHEGSVRYEIGNTNMKLEKNLCLDAYIGYTNSQFDFNLTGYINHFLDYIYLAPSSLEYIGYQIFYYRQQKADIEGIETTMNLHPNENKWMNLNVSYSYIVGKLGDGNNLPFIPAPRINSDLSLIKHFDGKLKNISFRPGFTYCFRQDRIGEFETPTSDYYLVNCSVSSYIDYGKRSLSIGITGNNLLNNAYYDHLSRFKYFGIYNIGRNISFTIQYKF